jgi:hypothetical protein
VKTPVALIIFKRPDTTERVFEVIRQAKPAKLLVVADGPRTDRPGESEKCTAARAIIECVDWDCEILKNYSDVNMGCKQRVSSGLDWVFNTVEEAIILEDDCVPDLTFFRFCEELLEKYRDDERIMTICGTNIQSEWKSDIQSYHFSYYGSVWGWASWRRAWKHYDVDMKLWKETEVKSRIRDILCSEEQYHIRKERFDNMYFGKVDSWDAQWLFTCLIQSGLSIVPSVNLISNIGFGKDGTHTINWTGHQVANISLHSMSFPLKEPCGMGIDRGYDEQLYRKLYKKKSLFQRMLLKLNRWRR